MLRTLIYEDEKVIESSSINDINEHLKKSSKIWVDIECPSDEELKILENTFKFHPLAIEDCIHKIQRSKVDKFDDYYFLILNAFKGRNIKRHFTYIELYVFMSEKYIVTVRWEHLKIIDNVYKRIHDSEHMFKKGTDFILYTIFDEIVDEYYPLTDSVEDKIDDIEERAISNPSIEIQNEILTIKRNIIKMRKILSPQREVINMLLRHEYTLISDENRMYFMDVFDHLLRIFDLLDTYQDLLSGTLELYMSQISNRMNSVMKVLTIITTIMMPLTVITGIYGMNFVNMPELHFKYGYFIVLIGMVIIILLEVIYFKKKKWM